MRIPLLCLVLLCVDCSYAPVSANRPNIIIILADDYGWGSAGSYGASGVATPNLDRLAREGRRFTQAYAPGSVCSPTRYGMLTGRYFWRTSVKDGIVLRPNAPLHVEAHRTTLASLCKSQGYRTAVFGKWHLGLGSEKKRTDWATALAPGPRAIGFDYFYGLAANPSNGPHSFIENEHVLGKKAGEAVAVIRERAGARTTGIAKPFEFEHIMEALTEKVTWWIEQNRREPFFVYFAPNAVHEPIAPNPKFTGSPYGRYGDFIHELDWSVGQVLATLDELELADRTLVIFTSDNGGEVSPNNATTARAMEAGLKINGDLRGGKGSEWEGGFRVPFIVRWSGQVPANSVSEQVISLTDLLATLARVLDVPLPKDNAEDSLDVLGAFTGREQGAPVRDRVVLQAADATYAIRMGDWKLVERVDPPKFEYRNKMRADQAKKRMIGAPKHDELFNLAADPSETKDVSAAHPDLVNRLREVLAKDRTALQTRP